MALGEVAIVDKYDPSTVNFIYLQRTNKYEGKTYQGVLYVFPKDLIL